MSSHTLEGKKKTQNGVKRLAFTVLSILLEVVFLIGIFKGLNEYAVFIDNLTRIFAVILVLKIYGRNETSSMKTPWIILILTLLAMIFEDKIGIKLCISGGIGALLLILTGVISEKDALKSIDLKTIFLFGGTLSLAAALQETGAGELIANKVIGALGENPSPYVLTFVVFILCCILTNFMSNTATTALMVPICLSIAQGMGADPRAVLMACVIGGSCAYATPIGMPANTMVVGAGGYKFMDYVKSGFPLIIIATVVSMIILPIAFPFFP